MDAFLRVAAVGLTVFGAAAIWHGDTANATLFIVMAIACRQNTTPERAGRE